MKRKLTVLAFLARAIILFAVELVLCFTAIAYFLPFLGAIIFPDVPKQDPIGNLMMCFIIVLLLMPAVKQRATNLRAKYNEFRNPTVFASASNPKKVSYEP
jgi:O-antigen/teichoic acid export membrane protein